MNRNRDHDLQDRPNLFCGDFERTARLLVESFMVRVRLLSHRGNIASVVVGACVYAAKVDYGRWALLTGPLAAVACFYVLRGFRGFVGLMDCAAYFYARRHEARQPAPALIFARLLGADWWRAQPDELAMPSESAALRLYQVHHVSVRSSALTRFYHASAAHALVGLAALALLFVVCVAI